MKNRDISSLRSGMVLGLPVRDHHNTILFAEGITLTEKHISTLKSWGVRDVWVVEDVTQPAVDDSEAAAETEEDSSSAALREKFRDVLDDPLMAEIMRAAGRLLQKRRLSSD
ncbi:MAG TPA: DUF3391 domain-containing protein [Thermodesulfobacteriota bacterium]|nr:DUF3391 domain-containing protein [Deltaproteobacteria bacterium]HNR13441.1 DUF3391 domain-containing protein [Thermodesulfobacteriota bacterium]HNU72291.1 DUF3391 domain-containing protein [Thermodesulfobacteriota bacterium]HQO78359.1 DUF3391 domain-containing protein [Thermodesulfobacteriota bacterium]